MQPTLSFKSSIAIKRKLDLGSPKTVGEQTWEEMELRMKFRQKKAKEWKRTVFGFSRSRKIKSSHSFYRNKMKIDEKKGSSLFFITISLNSIGFQSIIRSGFLC